MAAQSGSTTVADRTLLSGAVDREIDPEFFHVSAGRVTEMCIGSFDGKRALIQQFANLLGNVRLGSIRQIAVQRLSDFDASTVGFGGANADGGERALDRHGLGVACEQLKQWRNLRRRADIGERFQAGGTYSARRG